MWREQYPGQGQSRLEARRVQIDDRSSASLPNQERAIHTRVSQSHSTETHAEGGGRLAQSRSSSHPCVPSRPVPAMDRATRKQESPGEAAWGDEHGGREELREFTLNLTAVSSVNHEPCTWYSDYRTGCAPHNDCHASTRDTWVRYAIGSQLYANPSHITSYILPSLSARLASNHPRF